jgi:hypothetical protein
VAIDRVFGGQHDATWTPEAVNNTGEISVYNNSHGGGIGAYSSVDYWIPPLDSEGNYILEPNAAYGPEGLTWTYDGMPDDVFYSSRLSSAQRLPNGNTLICAGNLGLFFEVTTTGEIVWQYASPISGDNAVAQGVTPILNDVFRAKRYFVDYEAFDDRNLMSGLPLEVNPLSFECILDSVSLTRHEYEQGTLTAIPNPVHDQLQLFNPELRLFDVSIFAAGHLRIAHIEFSGETMTLDTDAWTPGIFIIAAVERVTGSTQIIKLIKL